MIQSLIKKIILGLLLVCLGLSDVAFAARGRSGGRSGGRSSGGRSSRSGGGRRGGARRGGARRSGARRSGARRSGARRSGARRSGRRSSGRRSGRRRGHGRYHRHGRRGWYGRHWRRWYGPGIGWYGFSWYPWWGCWFYPSGLWPWWWFPNWGFSFYVTASYPGVVIEADDSAVELWGAVYYRDPQTDLLVRYIAPRVVERQRVKWNVPVRKDKLERVVVISEREDDLDNELPGKPEKKSKLRYIPLKDPKGQESEGQENEVRLEDLSSDDVESLEKAKAQMRKKLKQDDVKGALQERAGKQEE